MKADASASRFTEALFTTANSEQQPRQRNVHQQRNSGQNVCMSTTGCYSALNRKAELARAHAATQTNLESITYMRRANTKGQTAYDSSFLRRLCVSRLVMSDSLRPHGLQPARLLCPWQEHWSGLLFPSPGDLPEPGIEPGSPALQADSLPSELR